MENPTLAATHRQQDLYWRELVQLKGGAVLMRRYRDWLGRWVTRIGVVRAVASSGGIAGWAIWKEFAFFWGVIIAASQVADALKDVFPLTKRHRAASDLAAVLDSMFIDAQFEWESILAERMTDDEIAVRRHKLMKMRLEVETKHLPDGFEANPKMVRLAEAEATVYFESMYRSGD